MSLSLSWNTSLKCLWHLERPVTSYTLSLPFVRCLLGMFELPVYYFLFVLLYSLTLMIHCFFSLRDVFINFSFLYFCIQTSIRFSINIVQTACDNPNVFLSLAAVEWKTFISFSSLISQCVLCLACWLHSHDCCHFEGSQLDCEAQLWGFPCLGQTPAPLHLWPTLLTAAWAASIGQSDWSVRGKHWKLTSVFNYKLKHPESKNNPTMNLNRFRFHFLHIWTWY